MLRQVLDNNDDLSNLVVTFANSNCLQTSIVIS